MYLLCYFYLPDREVITTVECRGIIFRATIPDFAS